MRRIGTLIVIIFATLFGATANAAEPGKEKTRPSYPQLFDALWSTVDSNFYDPYFLGHDWKNIGDRYRKELGTIVNDTQFESLADRMLGELGTSHLYLEPPGDSTALKIGIGVRFRTIAGEQLVSRVDPLSDARTKGLAPGDLLLSPGAALRGEIGTPATFTIKSCKGDVHTLSALRESAFWPPAHPGFDWHSVEISPKYTVGYLRIDRFDDGAAELADRAMAELKDSSALVIDLRENSGGNFSLARLASYFSGSARITVALFARPYLQALGHPVTASDVVAAAKVTGAYTDNAIFAAVAQNRGGASFMTEDLADKEYTRPVVVLIGENTGSAGEGFAWTMRNFTKATMIGSRTAGALLSGQNFDLPGGWAVTIPVQGLWGANGTDFRDKAIAPDIAVNWTRTDLCSGRDPDIEKALEFLKSRSAQ